MLNHVENASNVAGVGATISHHGAGFVTGAVGAVSGGAALVVGTSSPGEMLEAGWWFTHAQVWIFIPSQICVILGTLCSLVCTSKIVYEFCKGLKTKTRKPKTPPVIQGGSGSGHPPIKPQ